MKKKGILGTIGALSVMALASAAIYKGVKVTNKMKPYPKKFHLKTNPVFYENEFEADALAINMGHLALNFEEATLKDNFGTLKVFGHASKITIIVPEDWVVKTVGTAVNAKIINMLNEETDAYHPTLIIKHDIHATKLEVIKYFKDSGLDHDIINDDSEQN